MRRNMSTIYILAAIVLIMFFGLLGRIDLQWRWLLVMGTFIGLLALIGREVTGVPLSGDSAGDRLKPGRVDGALIDSRNKISLSRLQMVLWTVVVLSAWATFALHRVIPVVQGKLLASDVQLLQEVAQLLAGDGQAGEAETRQAAAMLEQITGAEVVISDEAAGAAAGPSGYDPLAISIPQEVWLALGISTISLAGAGIIKTNQATNDSGKAQDVAATREKNADRRATAMKNEVATLESNRLETLESMQPRPVTESMDAPSPPPDPAELARKEAELARVNADLKAAQAAAQRAEARAAELETARTTAVGELHAYTTSVEARWSDMLRGDTVANFQFIDLGKVQMFFLTVILVFTYAALIWSIMAMPLAARVLQLTPTMSLPSFSESLVIIMGLSHGGYLATKATV